MASIVVRGLDETVKKQLATRAKEHGRSMEAEVRDILTKAARRPHIGMALLAAAQYVGGTAELNVADAQIAAICLVNDATCATRNVKDFAHTGVELVDPWAAS